MESTTLTREVKKQMEVIRRGTVQIVPEEELSDRLAASLRSGQPLRVKYGADPSAPDIHLGHTIPLRKLREFQDLGHKVVFIIGDFTARVGDPSGQSQTRKRLSREEVRRNSRTYQEQVFKILDRGRTEVVYNSSWLSPMKFSEVIELAAKYTVARMLERDDFLNRFRKGQPISIVEFLYPLMQGYDSVAVKADIEIGGTDQTFNLLVAREIQREYRHRPQVILTLPLLEGTDGRQKMSKSLGNYIGVTEDPGEIYGKIMSISDELMWRYYELLSPAGREEIERGKKECARGMNPMAWKKRLAREVTETFSSGLQARQAEEQFERIHQERQQPKEIEEFQLPRDKLQEGRIDLVSLLRLAGLATTNSEARRKIAEGAVSINGKKIFEHSARVVVKNGDILRLGKRGFKKVVLD